MNTTVNLSLSIYPFECIREAIIAYKGYCEVNFISQQASQCVIEIIPAPEIEDSGQLRNEFLNYLLDLSVEKHLEAA